VYRLFLSLRYFRSRFLALAAFLAITFGVAMLLIVLSVMGGYMDQVRENIRGQESHLRIVGRGPFAVRRFPQLDEAILALDNIAAVAPFTERLAVFKSGVSHKPCNLHGFAPARQAGLTDFGRYVLRPAELDLLLEKYLPPEPDLSDDAALDAMLPEVEVDVNAAMREVHETLTDPERKPLSGDELAEFFDYESREKLLAKHNPFVHEALETAPAAVLVGAQRFFDQEVILGQILTATTLRPATGEPLTEQFVVAGAIKTGDFTVDDRTLFVDVRKLRSMLGLFDERTEGFRYQGIRVALEDPTRLEQTRDAVSEALLAIDPTLEVKTWQELKQNMLEAVQIEKIIVALIVSILVFFTALMILLMQILTVIEKTWDIGVLSALGATNWGLTSIFVINGLVISILGTAAGLGLGYGFCSYINEIHDAIFEVTGRQLFPAEIYQMDRIPVSFQTGDILVAAVIPVLFGFLASLGAAVLTPLRDPIKAIQHE